MAELQTNAWTPARPRTRPAAEPELSIVLPCYNEQENIHAIAAEITAHCAGIDFEMIFVDDASEDHTVARIQALQAACAHVRLVPLLRNAGHQNALRAGLRAARGRHVITMDADLQHPPSWIPQMLRLAREGADVVHMVRQCRQKGFFKNLLSRGFYAFFNSISDARIVSNASDYRLMSRRVVDVLNRLPERNLVLRVILPMLGFDSACLPFQQQERFAGQESYSLKKSLQLAHHSIFNFTTLPLQVGYRLGWGIAALAFIYALIAVYARLFTDRSVPGYTDIIASVLLLGGITLIYVGIVGKYVAIILEHLKNRPEYLIRELPSEPPRNCPPDSERS